MPKTRNHKRKNSRKSRKNRNKKGAGFFTKSPEMKLIDKLTAILYCTKNGGKTEDEAIKECGKGIREMCNNPNFKNDVGDLKKEIVDKIINKKDAEYLPQEYKSLFKRICLPMVPADQVKVVTQPDPSIPMVSADQVTVVSGGKRKSRKNRRNRRNRRSRRNKNKRSRKHR